MKTVLLTPNQYEYTEKPSEPKSLCEFLETLDVKQKTDDPMLGGSKEKCKTTRTGNALWSNITKRRDHTKTNQNFREALYKWILHHP